MSSLLTVAGEQISLLTAIDLNEKISRAGNIGADPSGLIAACYSRYVVFLLYKSAVRTNGLVRLYAIAILRKLHLMYRKSDFIFEFPVLELC